MNDEKREAIEQAANKLRWQLEELEGACRVLSDEVVETVMREVKDSVCDLLRETG